MLSFRCFYFLDILLKTTPFYLPFELDKDTFPSPVNEELRPGPMFVDPSPEVDERFRRRAGEERMGDADLPILVVEC